MKRGDRIRLKRDYKDPEFGFEYHEGQEGVVLNPSYCGSTSALIVWDGYEEEREADKRQREKDGEGFNVVSFYNTAPCDFLEVI